MNKRLDIDHHIETDWQEICAEYNLTSGDISPDQHARYGHAIEIIREVVTEFINQNQLYKND
jgi:hypothetical protein